MAATAISVERPPAAFAAAGAEGVPWYVAVGVLGITSSSLGTWWDVSWHESIGRDSFWNPAHVAIYMCGVLAGLVCTYLILASTFGFSPRLRAASVSILGIRAPLGAFVAAWGGLAMLTAAPFDNWWHAAYGLDVSLVSPPHFVIAAGMRAVTLGILLLASAAMSGAASERLYKRLQTLLLYIGGLLVSDQMLLLIAYTHRYHLHGTQSYRLTALMVLPILLLTRQVSKHRWAATWAAGVYTIGQLAFLYILPLFPAHPRLGPVYNPVTHMVPPSFPLLLIVPAAAVDLLGQRIRKLAAPWLALAAAVVFTLTFVAVEWPFASFLLSPQAHGPLFGTVDFPSYSHVEEKVPYFRNPAHGLHLWLGLLRAMVLSAFSGWAALVVGRWMGRVRR